LYFGIGHAVHKAARLLWEQRSLSTAIAAQAQFFTDAPMTSAAEIIAKQEALDLSEALATVWYRFRFQSLITEYEPVLLETPTEVVLYTSPDYQIVLYTVLDALLRHRDTGELVAWECKTTKSVRGKYLDGFENDFQIALELVAADSLRESLGSSAPVAGVMVEALLKGTTRQGRDGITRHSNGLVWPYHRAAVGDAVRGQWSPTYKHGWTPTLASQHYPGGLQAWMSSLGDDILVDYTRTVDPLRMSDWLRQSLVRQIVAYLRHEHSALEALPEAAQGTDEWYAEVDQSWPMNTKACLWPTPCAMRSLCFSPSVRLDPLGSGLYVHRPTIEERAAAADLED
jgi:hypothetical protein